jgi:hypothetical protein
MSSSSELGSSTSPNSGGSEEEPTIALLRAEYNKADGFCQEVQSFVDKAGIPAVNELRNAGKHLIDALADDGSVAHKEHIRLGIAHCRRACFEAYEAGILSALEVIHKFREDYATVPVSDVVPAYTEILKKAQTAQKSVEAVRDPNFNREQDHAVRMAAFRELRDCADTLTLGREEMNKKVADRTSTASTNTRLVVIGVLTLAATVLFGLWTASGFWLPGHHTAAAAPVIQTQAPQTVNNTTAQLKAASEKPLSNRS